MYIEASLFVDQVDLLIIKMLFLFFCRHQYLIYTFFVPRE